MFHYQNGVAGVAVENTDAFQTEFFVAVSKFGLQFVGLIFVEVVAVDL
ncbi:hypothetical protein L291_2861 [Acinetobacter guillouiae MSP4-18]|jgi:hypothetical protein|nr:hypothetical protein L291_2861 [Acinetobacter guillouiae MSP4-18]